MPYRILLVEDDTTRRETVACNLQRQGDGKDPNFSTNQK